MTEQRQHVRVPILTQVEAGTPNVAALGRARDLSIGGILIDTRETLPQGADVIIRFFIPPDTQPVEAAGRVVRVQPSKSMAIAFLGLANSYRQRILSYIAAAQASAEPVDFSAPREQRRRSGRIPRRIAVVLNWLDEGGRSHHEAAETRLLSRYGALLNSYSVLEPGRVLRLNVPERGQETRSRVVYSAAAELPGRADIAIEFVGVKDFWKIPFPEDTATLLPTRRRTTRILKAVPLELSWETELRIRHQEATKSINLSQHGVGLTTSGMLEAGRLLQVRQADNGRLATARIVWRAPSNAAGRAEMGIELLGQKDFWGLEFSPDRDYPQGDAKADSAGQSA